MRSADARRQKSPFFIVACSRGERCRCQPPAAGSLSFEGAFRLAGVTDLPICALRDGPELGNLGDGSHIDSLSSRRAGGPAGAWSAAVGMAAPCGPRVGLVKRRNEVSSPCLFQCPIDVGLETAPLAAAGSTIKAWGQCQCSSSHFTLKAERVARVTTVLRACALRTMRTMRTRSSDRLLRQRARRVPGAWSRPPKLQTSRSIARQRDTPGACCLSGSMSWIGCPSHW